MINELVVLADELDKLGEKEAADFVDNLIKHAAEEELLPLEPEMYEFDNDSPTGRKTKVDKAPELWHENFKARSFELEDATQLIEFIGSINPADYSAEDAARIVKALQDAVAKFSI